jgi:hypothetical protein
MKFEQAFGLTIFLMVWTFLICAYMKHTQASFTVNNETYSQVGIMAYEDSGIYLPIYKKRNIK